MFSPPADYNYQKLDEELTGVAKRKWSIVVLILGFVAFAEMCVTCYFFCYFTDQIAQMQQKLNSDNYPGRCLQYLNSYIDDLGESEVAIEDFMCDSWLKNFKFLINQRLQSDVRNLIHKELKAHNATFLGPDKPAIHLIAQHRNKPPKNAPSYFARVGGHDVLYWNDIKGLTVHRGAIKYHHGEITIPKDGIYYIYSQVYFWHIQKLDGEDQQYNLFLQYLYKMSMNYYEPILLTKAVYTKCWSKESKFDVYTSFQGALFELQQGDKLFIKVTNASAVNVNEGATYFGAFMIF
ncbi:tumor necrosis factor ligand superfamily member 10-like [Carcharodon carcharias]|uniref:tumor necrosis factor (ligand) superfamily, member 10 like 4 n=1 Tax=Carcharodon carcharias TaxID=13397 RepID=UPI001B7DCB02|nr:tumor necrosis factor (ligand) superfamily, member 10 like 4 [Carcharodon carcharias]